MSNWKTTLATFLTDLLRITIRVCLFIDGILLSLLSVYLTYRFVLHTGDWMNRTFFSSPW